MNSKILHFLCYKHIHLAYTTRRYMTYLFIYLPIIRGDTVVSISSIFCSWLCEFLQKVVIFVRYTTTRVARTIIIIRVNTTSNGTPNECVALFIRWDCVVFLDWFEVLFSSVSVEFVIRVTVLFVTLLGRRSPVLFCEGCVASLWLPGITFILLASF